MGGGVKCRDDQGNGSPQVDGSFGAFLRREGSEGGVLGKMPGLEGAGPSEEVTREGTEDWENEGGKWAEGRGKGARLRVLLIGHQFQLRAEGQAKAGALGRFEDLEVHVAVPTRYREGGARWRYTETPEESEASRVSYHLQDVRLPWASLAKWYLQFYPGLPRLLCECRPDIIDVWEEPWSLLSAEVCWLRNWLLPSARLISETEQNISKTLPPPFEWFRSVTFRNADFLVGRNSEALRVARGKGYWGPARVVGNGVSRMLFRPMDPAEKQRCRQLFGMRGFSVGYAGRLVPEKGIEDLVGAVEGMEEDTELWVCGDGKLGHNGALRGERVHRLDGLSRERLCEFFNALDVLVLPSRTTRSWKEQFGRVLIEAQSCGTVVIGSDSGAIPEVIGEAGLVFPEQDAYGLRSALERLKRNPELRAQLADAGKRQAGERYSWEAIAERMHGIYRDLGKRGEGGPVSAVP